MKIRKSYVFSATIIFVLCCSFDRHTDSINSTLRSGDIIFHISTSSQSKAIQLATKSKYSHVGIIYEIDGSLYVYEAIQPVRFTRLEDWIARGEGRHYVVKRLKNAATLLTKESLKRMKDIGGRFKGKSYDLYFEWSDERIYCSELVWKIYNEALNIEIGKLQQLQEFDLSSPVVRQKMRERYGENIPMTEKVISPAAMFESELLEVIAEK